MSTPETRITELRIEGLRSIGKLHLRLDGLTVLIGENGSGKSSIIEACQLLRAVARSEFDREFYGTHGGLSSLLRWDETRLTLGVRVEHGTEPPLDYDIVFLKAGEGSARIHGESLRAGDSLLLERSGGRTRVQKGGDLTEILRLREGSEPTLAALGAIDVDARILRIRDALERIEVHVPFETLPLWASRARARRSALRSTLPIQRADRLELLGENLPNAYYALVNDYDTAHWNETLAYVRLGLGEDVERVTPFIDPGGGAIGLSLELRGRGKVPTSILSDGQLAYLAFVALHRLNNKRSLLVFDEPDLHLHPGLLARVVQFLEADSERHPVLIATHSDAMIDALSEPARSVRVCELELPQRKTVVRSLDRNALARWLQDYRGVGHIRNDGFLSQVVDEERR